jgi:hypothetical protein
MISQRTLGLVNHVCQLVRQQGIPMGGLQCVFVGDFKVGDSRTINFAL